MSNPSAPASAKVHAVDRDDALDGVRGLAVVMVLSIHMFVPTPDNAFLAFIEHVFHSMFIATDLFFVLSGFLITSILVRTRGRPGYFKSFYWRRALRILPAYTLILVFAFIVAPAFFMPPEQAAAVRAEGKWYAAYLQNFVILFDEHSPWMALRHLWSLSVEEQFYILWPVCIALVPTRSLQKFCAAVFLLGTVVKFALFATGSHWAALYLFTPCRVEGLAAGSWIAVRCALRGDAQPPAWLRPVAAPAALALLVLIVWPYPAYKLLSASLNVFHTWLASIAFAWLIYEIVAAPQRSLLRRFFQARLFIFLGTYSYGIYLIHFFVENYLVDWGYPRYGALLPQNAFTLLVAFATLVISLPLALLMFHLVEKPALSLKDWVRTGPAPRPAEPAVAPEAAAPATPRLVSEVASNPAAGA